MNLPSRLSERSASHLVKQSGFKRKQRLLNGFCTMVWCDALTIGRSCDVSADLSTGQISLLLEDTTFIIQHHRDRAEISPSPCLLTERFAVSRWERSMHFVPAFEPEIPCLWCMPGMAACF